MSHPKLTLRPPPHREFVQGYPGIPGSSSRPPAHLAGNVEVRLGTKGLKASWLRIELRKLETLPAGESWGELIGHGPIDVWTASKSEAYKSEDEQGWELLQTADFPFQVVIPEGLPPSAKLDKQAGVAYELVTSLCVRSKKGLLRKETTSSIIQNTHPIWLEKHELHSAWPVYHYPDEHETTLDDIRVKLHRSQTCYGPGDQVDVRIIVSSDSVKPVKLKTLSFSIRETITFRGGTRKTFGSKNAAIQKTENLASKAKSFGKKVYKGDIHTFDLSCSIPKSHTLMTIQTAKHIEVAYTIRVQVDAGKKPIVIDHLPITLSNFATSSSGDAVAKIGFVPGLSTAAAPEADGPASEGGDGTASLYSSGAPTITRSQSFAPSSFNASYLGYPASDLRRRDTVMTQGTAITGPGMAGRGVPGQVFLWGEYGAAQPLGSEAPRPAFAGPPSIYEGHELAPEENRALFHASNRPQSAYGLGSGIDPVFLPVNVRQQSGSRQGPRNGERQVTPIREASEEMYAEAMSNNGYQGPRHQRSLSNPTRAHRSAQDAPSGSTHETHLVRPDPVRGPGPPIKSAEAEKERLYERARQQAERNQRRADERRAQYGTHGQATIPPTLGGEGQSSSTLSSLGSAQEQAVGDSFSAANEKARLFERARAEAEKYQTSFAQGAQFPALAPAASGSSSSLHLSRNDPCRTSAQYWLQEGTGAGVAATAAPGSAAARSAAPAAAVAGSASSSASHSSAPGAHSLQQPFEGTPATSVSGRPAPYPTYVSAEEEKRRLYEQAKAETEVFQRGDPLPHHQQHRSSSYSEHDASATGHQGAALSGSAYTVPPGGWPRDEQSTPRTGPSSATAIPSSIAAPAISHGAPSMSNSVIPPPLPSSSSIGEKEQLRRYYEAQDAVARHQAGVSAAGGSGSGVSSGPEMQQSGPANGGGSSGAMPDSRGIYACGVTQVGARASPHQPEHPVASPRGDAGQTTLYNSRPNEVAREQARSPTQQPASSAAQSYLTEAEQQSAREKERLATHFAKKAARAEARAASAAANGTPATGSGGSGMPASHTPVTTASHGSRTPTHDAAPLPPVVSEVAASVRPTASYANGYDHGRTASSGSIAGARRAPSVMGGRPLPGSSNHSPSASFIGSPGITQNGYSTASGASEKAQLAAYYAAKDAAEQTAACLQLEQQQEAGWTPTSAPTASNATRDWLPRIETGASIGAGTSSLASYHPHPRSDDTSSIYTEVAHDPEVLASKKRASPSILSASASGTGGVRGGMYDSPFSSRPSSVVYPHDTTMVTSPSTMSSNGGGGTRWKQAPTALRKNDPDFWRPKYAWLEEDDEELDTAKTKVPPPLPPKIPLSRNASKMA